MRRTAHLLATLASLILVACVQSGVPARSEVVAPLQLQAEVEELVEQRQLPGAIVIISRDGQVIDRAMAGWQSVEQQQALHEEAIFRLYSMSKPVTSVAIMMLAEQGRLSIDDPVEHYLPELGDMQVYVSGPSEAMVTRPALRSITIGDLLTHNSGIVYHFTGNTPVHQYYRRHGVMRDTPVGRTPEDGPPARSLDELVERIGAAPLLHDPGEGFHYSYSTTVLGAVIERATGQTLDKALADMLFAPLGMTDTGFFIDDERLDRFTTLYSATEGGFEPAELPIESDYRDTSRLLDGGGALAGTAQDYLRFATMLANGGSLEGKRYLSEEAVQSMFAPHVVISGMSPQDIPFGYGFAIGTEETAAAGGQPAGTVSWSGSGNTYFLIDPETRTVGLLMTNLLTPGSTVERSDLFRSIVNEAFEDAER